MGPRGILISLGEDWWWGVREGAVVVAEVRVWVWVWEDIVVDRRNYVVVCNDFAVVRNPLNSMIDSKSSSKVIMSIATYI